MKKWMILLMAMAVFFGGCATKQQIPIVKKELPSWYLKPPQTTDKTLYATGEGKDRKAALRDALSLLASTLSVYVESKFHSKATYNDGEIKNYELQTSNEIKSSVKKIRISNYKVLHGEEFSFERYIVLIKVDKKQLFEILKKDVDNKFANIEKAKQRAENYSTIKQFKICKDAKNSLKDIKNTLLVMQSLDDKFDANIYTDEIQSIYDDYEKLQSRVVFVIKTDKKNSDLKEVVTSALNTKLLQVVENSKSKKDTIKIYIKNTITQSKAYGFVMIRSVVLITLKDYRGNIIASNKIKFKTHSQKGYADARDKVAQKLYDMIQKDGIAKVLGLSI